MDRADLEEVLTHWAAEQADRGRIADALSVVLVDYEVMLPRTPDRKEYRAWVKDSIGGLGDALMAAWDERYGGNE